MLFPLQSITSVTSSSAEHSPNTIQRELHQGISIAEVLQKASPGGPVRASAREQQGSRRWRPELAPAESPSNLVTQAALAHTQSKHPQGLGWLIRDRRPGRNICQNGFFKPTQTQRDTRRLYPARAGDPRLQAHDRRVPPRCPSPRSASSKYGAEESLVSKA